MSEQDDFDQVPSISRSQLDEWDAEARSVTCELPPEVRYRIIQLIHEVLLHRAELQIARNDMELMEHCANVRERDAYRAAWSEHARTDPPCNGWEKAFKEWKER